MVWALKYALRQPFVFPLLRARMWRWRAGVGLGVAVGMGVGVGCGAGVAVMTTSTSLTTSLTMISRSITCGSGVAHAARENGASASEKKGRDARGRG